MNKPSREEKQTAAADAMLGEVLDSKQDEERFGTLSDLEQTTTVLIEKICALNMCVVDSLIGIDSRDLLRIIAEDLKVHIDLFLDALGEADKYQRAGLDQRR
jgi:hypothetical protein